MGEHADFRVRGKVFAYFLNDHHGDGIVSVCFKAAKGENEIRVREDPRRCYLPAYIGPRGWFGLRLDVGAVNWAEVDHLSRRKLPTRRAEDADQKTRRGKITKLAKTDRALPLTRRWKS